ncbi:MAG: threonine synthase [Candidatus Eisenbacteria bacterium]|nr:threonine synthase [Candidatus Eisenbacteria bacterium]
MKFSSDLCIQGSAPHVDFRTAVLSGLAPDGGLYVPESLPTIVRAPGEWRPQSLIEAGVQLLAPFVTDKDTEELTGILRSAWDFPAPITILEPGIHLLELFHGPTLAFKDFGARFLARYLEHPASPLTILVATSGDTGGAVAAGFHGASGITVYILYPAGRVSPIQEAQMATLGGNIRAIEVAGSFDDCQRLVKAALGDRELRATRTFTTANSINIGRLLPQLAYHGWAAGQMDRPTLVIPSGNFGNLTAALYARAMGVPIGRCVAALNTNDVIRRYLGTGTYRPEVSCPTISSAMDVGNPSNLTRLLHLAGGSTQRLASLFEAHSVDDDDTQTEIRRAYESAGQVIDPHTAVGVAVARRLLAAGAGPLVVAATAHPAKFTTVIESALGIPASRWTIPSPVPPALAEAISRPKLSRKLPADEAAFGQLLRTDP